MLKLMKYALRLVLPAVAAACLAVACINDHYPEDYDIYAGNTVQLSLSMQMPATSTTRATEGLPAERLRDLRIVIVSFPTDSRGNDVAGEEAFVEVNQLLHSVTLNIMGQRELLFEHILSDRRKKIYFLANCESSAAGGDLKIRTEAGETVDLTADETYLPPAADGKAKIDDCIFDAPSGTHENARFYGSSAALTDYCVPVTAVHELSVPTVDEIRRVATGIDAQLVCRIEKPLYLVRAVNKINVTIANNTGVRRSDNSGEFYIQPSEVRFKSFKISKISTGKSYLLAHLDEQDPLFKNYQPSAEELAKPVYERRDLNPAWVQWLAEEARKSQNDSYKNNYQWLTEYYLPEEIVNVESEVFTFADAPLLTSSMNGSGNSEWTTPAVYLPETLYYPDLSEEEDDDDDDDDEAEAAAVASEQQYLLTCSFDVTRHDSDEPKTISYDYKAVLPNLKSLFRNTHVKVRLSITDNADVELILEVLPWTLAPEEEWHYERIPGMGDDGWLEWEEDTYEYDSKHDDQAGNEANYQLVVKTDGSAAVGTFTIATPVNDEWYAYLVPLTGHPDAFLFVDENGNEIATPHGIIDGKTAATIRVRQREQNTAEQNTAKLQIMVRTADNRFLEADVCEGAAAYYMIIQNRNVF